MPGQDIDRIDNQFQRISKILELHAAERDRLVGLIRERDQVFSELPVRLGRATENMSTLLRQGMDNDEVLRQIEETTRTLRERLPRNP